MYGKLIKRLQTESLYRDQATLKIMDLCMDAASALTALQAENAEKDMEIERLQAKAKQWKRTSEENFASCEKLQAALTRVEAERDGYKRALHLAIETHSVDQRQIDRLERYYLEQARGAQGEG